MSIFLFVVGQKKPGLQVKEKAPIITVSIQTNTLASFCIWEDTKRGQCIGLVSIHILKLIGSGFWFVVYNWFQSLCIWPGCPSIYFCMQRVASSLLRPGNTGVNRRLRQLPLQFIPHTDNFNIGSTIRAVPNRFSKL